MGRRRFAAVGVMVLVYMPLAACGTSTDPGYDLDPHEGEGVVGQWVRSGFFDRTYYLHLPAGMDTTAGAPRRPLLIMLHGAGDTGVGFHARIAADEATDAAGFVVAYPDGVEASWAVGCDACTAAERLHVDDVTFLATLTRQLARALPVDSLRVFVAGYSQGGQLAQLFACESPSSPAGIAVVAGSPYKAAAARCAPRGPFPVVVVHGDRDPVIPYRGAGAVGGILISAEDNVRAWAGLMACDAAAAREEHPDTARDGTTYTSYRYPGCAPGSTVLLDRVNRGGHTWPGATGPWSDLAGRHSHNLDATAEIVGAFRSASPGS